VILVGLAIDQIAQSGLSSLSVIYYSAQLFRQLTHPACPRLSRDRQGGHLIGIQTLLNKTQFKLRLARQ
ncbi:hypothetical protein P9939_05370, partial [Serratia nevei]|uniref:hypothetical protein n=1 Tax=Serratia nevei TaxID=2703794 RepID=UPI00254CDCE4